jgi:altronate dehydratase
MTTYTIKSSSSPTLRTPELASRLEAANWAQAQAQADAMSWGLNPDRDASIEHIFDSATSISDADGCGVVGYKIIKLTHVQATLFRREEVGTVMIVEIEEESQASSEPQHTTEIKYDRKSKDYAVIVDMNVIGFARNYSEGEMLANTYIGELEALAASAAPTVTEAIKACIPIMSTVTYAHPFSGEAETAVVTVITPLTQEAA